MNRTSFSTASSVSANITQTQLESFLHLAQVARGDSARTCSLGERRSGGFNVAVTVRFDDGLEWIVKTPKDVDDTALERLESEIATLIFLETIPALPTARVHGYSINTRNPAGAPYVIMDKLPGITLAEAVHHGLDRSGINRAIEGAANFRKVLQQYPFSAIGSIYLLGSQDYCGQSLSCEGANEKAGFTVAHINNTWSAFLEPTQYRRYFGTDSTGYYIAQHALSLRSEPVYGDREEKKKKNLIHFHLGLALPCYIIESTVFYLTHTDLSISNVLVNPDDGTLLGIIDWEFANTLPPQAVEHYPAFLARRSEFVELYESFYEDPNVELDRWRAHYNKQFDEQSETAVYNDRIDAIIDFESLLRDPNSRTLSKIADSLETLQIANALSEPLPSLPWLTHLLPPPSQQLTTAKTDVENTGPQNPSPSPPIHPPRKPKRPGVKKLYRPFFRLSSSSTSSSSSQIQTPKDDAHPKTPPPEDLIKRAKLIEQSKQETKTETPSPPANKTSEDKERRSCPHPNIQPIKERTSLEVPEMRWKQASVKMQEKKAGGPSSSDKKKEDDFEVRKCRFHHVVFRECLKVFRCGRHALKRKMKPE